MNYIATNSLISPTTQNNTTPSSPALSTNSSSSLISPARRKLFSIDSDGAPPSPILPKNHAHFFTTLKKMNDTIPHTAAMTYLVLEGLDPLEIARQFTVMESKIYNSIEVRELMGLNWSKNKNPNSAVSKMSQISTQITMLVAEVILAEPDVKKRAIIIKQFIKIGDVYNFLKNIFIISINFTYSVV